MLSCRLLAFTVAVVICPSFASIIQSPRTTDRGTWGEWEECPSGQFALGFQLKTEGNQGEWDDSALNGIKLFCGLPGSRKWYSELTSLVGPWGDWGRRLYCNEGVLVGFQIDVESSSSDNSGANQFDGFCSTEAGKTQTLLGDGLYWGDTKSNVSCPTGLGICGIKTQVEGDQGSGDDTGLNNVDMKCCTIPEEVSPAMNEIRSPKVTNWGYWGTWEECPPGTFASGFQMKLEGNQAYGDDTSVNGIKLLCGQPGSPRTEKTITSLEGSWGGWGEPVYCEGGLLTGFQIRSEPENVRDNAATHDFKGFCKTSGRGNKQLEGNGLKWGQWTEKQHCEDGMAICGLSTQVDMLYERKRRLGRRRVEGKVCWLPGQLRFIGPVFYTKVCMEHTPCVILESCNRGESCPVYLNERCDRTGLNNVDMKCCPYKPKNCTASDHWAQVSSCDNLGGMTPLTCSYKETVGVGSNSGSKTGGDSSSTNSHSLEFGLTAGGGGVEASFKAGLGKSQTTGHNWGIETSKTFNKETEHMAVYEVPAKTKIIIYQVVGVCGVTQVHTATFRKEEIRA